MAEVNGLFMSGCERSYEKCGCPTNSQFVLFILNLLYKLLQLEYIVNYSF